MTLWGRDHFRNNVRLAMVIEALGLGPRFYCVMRTYTRGFSERLFLLLQFLPHERIYLELDFGLLLRAPFDMSAHVRQVGEAICQRILPNDEVPNTCLVCNTCLCDHVMEGLVDL